MEILYRILKIILRPIFYLIFRVSFMPKNKVKNTSNAIVIANHRSNLDTFFMHFIFKNKIYLLAKEELFRNRLLGAVCSWLGAIKIKRGMGDTTALKAAKSVLKEGKLLGIFPEGTRRRLDNMGMFKDGATILAMANNVPIIPVYFSRTFRPFCKTYILIGEPINITEYAGTNLSDRTCIKRGTDYLYYKMQCLEEESKCYANHKS